MGRYYALYQGDQKNELYIFGDITSAPFFENDVSSYAVTRELAELDNTKPLTVYINSYGGEAAEGLAIYNTLKRFGDVTTVCDGFAASAASVIFMAGTRRVMNDASLLFIHNAWTYAAGNADELRKEAEDLEKISAALKDVYLKYVSIAEDELDALLSSETWLNGDEAVAKGFATEKAEAVQSTRPQQSVRGKVMNLIKNPKPAEGKPQESQFQKFFKAF